MTQLEGYTWTSLSGVAQWKSKKKALTDEAIYTTRMTHGDRHAEAMEVEGLGIPFDLIKRGGGWKNRLGRLETHYLEKLPSSFARGMASFWEKPFSLPRSSVSPPLELQRMVFPWIESYYGEGNLESQTVCDKEMKEFDENEDEEANILNLEVEKGAEAIEFVEEDGRMVQKKQKGKGKKKAVSSVDTAKRGLMAICFLSYKPRNVDDYNLVVSAKIPDPVQFLLAYAAVTRKMRHGLCGEGLETAPSMKGDKCLNCR